MKTNAERRDLSVLSDSNPARLAITQITLGLGRPLRHGEAPAIRGFFGRQFEEHILMHNHEADGSVVYTYPLVQYKVLQRRAILVGINEGSDLLQRLWLNIDEAKIGNEQLPVIETKLSTSDFELAITAEPQHYQFVTPWLGLNQKNFQLFRQATTDGERIELLNRSLIGNCLSLCKSLNIRLHERLMADCTKLQSMKTTLKGQTMVGQVGVWSVNLKLPDHIGLGKSVSRGFGCIERQA